MNLSIHYIYVENIYDTSIPTEFKCLINIMKHIYETDKNFNIDAIFHIFPSCIALHIGIKIIRE